MEPSKFFAKLKPGAYEAWHKYKVLPSIVAAQGALESAWGESGLTKRANNLFGIKGSYKGQSVTMATQEDGAGGMYWINDSFRKYPSWNESIVDHSVLVGTKQPYTGLRIPGDRDYRSVASKLTGSYATDRSYASKLITIIEANGLAKWDLDAFNGGDGGGFFGGGDEYKTFRTDEIKKNPSTRPGIKLKGVKGIVIHEIRTDLTLSAFKKQLNSGNSGNKMGYHILIDSKDAYNIVPFTEGVYHADRTGERVISALGNANENTLSVGIISNRNGDFTDEALKKAALACGELLNIYKLNADKIYYGFIVDKVQEPSSWVKNNFLYTSFMAIAQAAKEAGKDVITNPDYEKEPEGGTGTGMIPGGSGIIKKLIEYSLGFEGKITYILGARDIRVGGTGDCASYTQAMFLRTTGRDIGPNTWAQVKMGKDVPVSQLRAGDLVFFNGDNNPPSHVGLVISKGMMINLQNRGCIVESYTAWSSFGAPAQWGRRLFTDSEYDEAMKPKEDEKPTINTKKAYTVGATAPVALSSSPTGGETVRRLNVGERYRAQEIDKDTVKLGNNLFAFRSSPFLFFNEMNTPYDEIGTLTTKLKTAVYSGPSLSSEPVESLGTAKYHPPMTVLSIYAIQNGLAQVSPPGYTQEWIPSTSSFVDMDMYDLKTFTQEMDYSNGALVQTRAVAKEIDDSGYTTAENLTVKPNGIGIIVHELLLPIGAVVDIKIPTLPSFNRKCVVVGHNLTTNPNNIEILMNKTDAYNFGERAVQARFLHIADNSEILKILANEEEEEHDFT